MKSYARYKDSGISWIGKIPEHWGVIPLKRLFQERKSGAWGDDERKNKSDRICLRIADFDMARLRLKKDAEYTVRNYTEDVISKCFLSNGDILVEKSGGGEKTPVGRAVIYDLKLIEPLFANFMDRLRCYETVNPIYAVYLWNLMYKKGAVWNYVKATTGIQNLDIAALLSSEQATLPPLAEQKSIAAYLDEKTGQINRLVAAKQKQIELLKEYKQSLIANAVTKGINPKAKMKDSGINWIGQIPAHWEMSRIKHYFAESDEKTFDESATLLSLSQYTGISLKSESPKVGMSEAETTEGYKVVHKGQFVMNIMLAWNGSYAVSDLDGVISPAYCVFDFVKDCDKWYFHYLLRIKAYSGAFKTLSKGIIDSRLRLYPNKFYTFPLIVPPIDEQKQIVAFINERVSSIDSQISSIEKQIANLNEYKQSLISDVVTGKVKV